MARLFWYCLKSLRMRCPHCQQESITRYWYGIREKCGSCGYVYQGESGDFWGGVVISYAFGGVAGMLTGMVIVSLGLFETIEMRVYVSVFTGLGALVLLFPWSKSLWTHIMYATRGHYEEYRVQDK